MLSKEKFMEEARAETVAYYLRNPCENFPLLDSSFVAGAMWAFEQLTQQKPKDDSPYEVIHSE